MASWRRLRDGNDAGVWQLLRRRPQSKPIPCGSVRDAYPGACPACFKHYAPSDRRRGASPSIRPAR
ncbi:hypothetical protein Shyhy01_19000 [Streptomyces hygroscopicus subsp. hygroscopicus]|nr:hypothetical protein Shyhy01_19000 [Streptomyces hygroscopicus subsp. hygroscopicus]